MTVLVSVVNQMIANGEPIDAVACASTGTPPRRWRPMALPQAFRQWCSCPGIKYRRPSSCNPWPMRALVLSLDTDFDGCMAAVQEVTKHKHIYLANSMNSLRIEGQKTIAIEIVQQFDWEVPDWVILPGRKSRQRKRHRQGFR